MTDLIQGAKGGSSSPHAATEAPDSLHSIAYARILDLVSEGEIQGFKHGVANALQDIYLNETPVANADNSLNFKNVQIDTRTGTQSQGYMPGYPDVESETAVGLELKSSTPWTQSISDLTLSALRVRLSVPSLQKSDTSTGDITGYTISYKIELQTDGGAFVTMITSDFTGKTTSKYERSHRIDLPYATTGWVLRVTRLTANANLATIADTTTIESYTTIVDAKFRYPNSALVGVIIDASQFTSIPTRAYDLYGRIIAVPSNYDPVARTYATTGTGTSGGAWDGTFKPAWTNNPAWVFYDIVTNTRYGLGNYVSAGLLNKWSLYTIAQYCDGSVSNGFGGTEPRFTANLYLQAQGDAYKVLQDLASIFRGMSYWAGGAIQAVADMPADPVYTYTQANVIGGKFTYQGSGRKTRYTVALVSWNDPADFGRAKVEYVPDNAGIARYGVQPTSVTGFGCTSQAQAQRIGSWTLLTSRLETETVNFSVGLDGTITAPGQTIRVADSARAGKRQGGRIHSATTTAVTVDAAPTVAIGDTLTVTLPTGVTQTQTVSAVSGNVITVGSAFSAAPQPESAWVVESTSLAAQTFRVLSILEDGIGASLSYSITALAHNASKFAAIDSGAAISIPPVTAIPPSSQPAPATVTISSVETAGAVLASVLLTIQWDAVPSAVWYECEWQKDNGEWQSLGKLRGLSADLHNAKPGIYLARVRAVNASGIGSISTVSSALNVADQTLQPAFVAAISQEAANAQSAANAANTEIAAIASDGIISAGAEKSAVIRDYNVIVAEQSGIDAQAVDFSITTEKTAYDSAITALTNYLATLTTPTLWSNQAGNTTADGPTLRAKFASVYTTKQTLLNKIYASAQALANGAQTTGNTAIANAAAANAAAANAAAAAANAQSSAAAANAELAAIASNGILSPAEKPTAIRDYSVITTEQSGIDAQAVSFLGAGSSQQVAYDNAVTALTNYLGTLTSATAWNDKTGNTTVVAATFDGKFNAVYTTRQTLLNAIYAAAKAKADTAMSAADAAQGTADTGVALTSQTPVLDPNFSRGLTYWTPDGPNQGWFGKSGGTPPNPNATTYASHEGSGGTTYNTTHDPDTALRSNTYAPCSAGQVLSASALINGTADVNGRALVRFSWRNAAQAEIIVSEGNSVTAYTGGTSRISATAPAGAVYVHVEVVAYSHTTGYWNFAGVTCSYLPASIDEVPDGPTYGRTANSYLNGNRPLMDFGDTWHRNKNLDYIGDGPTYGRTANSYLNGNRPLMDFGDTWHRNKNLDYMADGNSRFGAIHTPGQQTGIYAPGSNMVKNPSFALGGQYWSLGYGWGVVNLFAENCVAIPFTTTATTSVSTSDLIAVGANLVLSLSADVYLSASLTSGDVSMDVEYFNASGGFIGGGLRLFALGAGMNGFVRNARALAATPAGTASCHIRVFTENAAAANGAAYVRRVKLEVGSVATPFDDLGTQTGNQLGQPGSGVHIGDQRNLTAVTFGNYGSGWSGLSLSYTATATSATISASAATLQAGGVAIGYNASSVTVSGSAGATVKYYLYYDDPGLTGGALTLQATTNPITSVASDGRVSIASISVTYPTSGSGGGSGGGSSSCPVREAWVRRKTATGYEDVQAGSIVVGDRLRIMDPATGAKRWGLVSHSAPAFVPCVRFVTADGLDLSCSTTAPIGTDDGRAVLAPELRGQRVPADDVGAYTVAAVDDVQPIGEQWVQHITCEDDFFLAGNQRGRYVAHHNMKPPVP